MLTKRIAIIVLILAAAGIIAVAVACGKVEDDSTAGGGLLGDTDDDGGDDDTAGVIGSVPDGVNDFLSSGDIEALEGVGMPIHYGDAPTVIEGRYVLDSLLIVYDETGDTGAALNIYDITFHDQSGDGSLKTDYNDRSSSDSGFGVSAFISGDGACFTVFADASGALGDCRYSLPFLFSGCQSAGGIQNFHWGMIMKRVEGTGCAVMPVGAVRIIQESDGLAEKTLDWLYR
jgi:hypothetical protein